MSTARDLIKGSLRLIGAIASGETPTADEQADALSVLNDMLDSWSNENLTINAKTIDTFTLVPSQAVYTYGLTGNFNSARPQKIEFATIKDVNGIEFPLDIINQDQWAAIQLKTIQAQIPRRLFAEGSYPFERVNLWPVPSVANSLVVYAWKPLTQIATVNTSLSVPAGYKKALRYNLAIELAPEYGLSASAEVIAGATEGKENIKRMNVKPIYVKADEALVDRRYAFNILTGE